MPPLVLVSQQEWEEPNIKALRYKALVKTNRGRPRAGAGGQGGDLPSPFCFTDFYGRMDGFSPLSGADYIFCQFKGMSQLLPPPVLPIHFYGNSLQPH